MKNTYDKLAISSLDQFVFGKAPKPVTAGRGVVFGGGPVIPELNFTLPPMQIEESTMPIVERHYTDMINGVCERAVELKVPGLLVEFETLPPMTVNPAWGLKITEILSSTMRRFHKEHGLNNALRLTPNDTRENQRPPLMRQGKYWQGMQEFFAKAPAAGADLLSIESTGGKEICDEALMMGDIRTLAFALGSLAPRDMEFLWAHMVKACAGTSVLPAGDSACGFGNTAMVLAEQKLIPRVLAAIVRVMTVPRALVAFEQGCVGPSKDCAYENVYLKAITGSPMSFEGRDAACAHLSPVGNIAQCVADAWSNESVQNVRLLSASAPVVSLEQLAYSCRMMDAATKKGPAHVAMLRDCLVDSDAYLDPQAWVLRPDVAIKLSAEMLKEKSPYLRVRRGAQAAVLEIREAHQAGKVEIPQREMAWLAKLEKAIAELPTDEQELIDEMKDSEVAEKFLPAEYGL